MPAGLGAAQFLGGFLMLPAPYKRALGWSLPSVSCGGPAALRTPTFFAVESS